jgi:penicillin-binding protein 2
MNVTDERRRVTLRLNLIQFTITALFAALAIAFWYFQVVQHVRFREMAENNHQRTLALRAPRGVLFDRHGAVLVENRDAFNISIVPEHTKDRDRTLRLLARVTGVDEQAIRATLERQRGTPRYRPIVVIQDASLSQVAAVMARRLDFELPDVVVERVPTRHYPVNEFAAHLFGYVGEVNEAQMAAEGFRMGTIVGQSGVEKVYNELLMGEDGARRVIVNSVGREMSTLEEVRPHEGRRVQLTIDFDVQRAAEEAFQALGYWGSAVALDPRNGEVLALVSLPAYDPNAFASRIDRATWASLNADALKPLQNRAIQGRYSPGSTFKVAVAVAALESGVATPDFKVNCTGGAFFYGRYFKCHKAGGHGVVDMRRAMEQSCNTYFYTLGNMVGVDRIQQWSAALGLGEKSGIDLPNEVQGLVPSTAWKLERMGEKWYAGETISVAIGQGQVSVTPISLAVMMATLANGGTRHTPHLVRAIDEGRGWQPTQPPHPQSITPLKPATIEALHEGLWRVVNGAGTGGRARLPGRDVAGKTGTAQVISIQGRQAAAGKTDRDLRDHGWFVFFAPAKNPEIAGVVFAEHGEGGGRAAAPIAKYMIETYFAKKEGTELPQFPKPAAPATVATAQRAEVPTGGQM